MTTKFRRYLATILRGIQVYVVLATPLHALRELSSADGLLVPIRMLEVAFALFGIWAIWRAYSGFYRTGDFIFES